MKLILRLPYLPGESTVCAFFYQSQNDFGFSLHRNCGAQKCRLAEATLRRQDLISKRVDSTHD